MESTKKYTYRNWWKGEVILVYAPRIVPTEKKEINVVRHVYVKSADLYAGKWNSKLKLYYASQVVSKCEKPVIVDWSAFSKSTAQKIKEKQKLIFAEKVASQLSKIKEIFTARFESSFLQSKLLDNEIKQCTTVMFGNIPNGKYIRLSHWDIYLESEDLFDIQNYIKKRIERGIDGGNDYIHSPLCKYQNFHKIPSQIYAQFVFEYCEWLNKLRQSRYGAMTERKKSKANLVDKLWFKIGLSFATGEMETLIVKHSTANTPNCTAIAKELGNKHFRPYISESISKSSASDKNIFSSPRKLSLIYKHCTELDLQMTENFIKLVNSL